MAKQANNDELKDPYGGKTVLEVFKLRVSGTDVWEQTFSKSLNVIDDVNNQQFKLKTRVVLLYDRAWGFFRF